MKIQPKINEALVASADFTPLMEKAAWESAEALVACGDGFMPSSTTEVLEGAAFRIPVLLPEGLETGDAREFDDGVTEVADLPMPLLWQMFTDDGHKKSVIVGRIDYVERIGDEEESLTGEEGPVSEIVGDLVEEAEDAPISFRGWGNAVGVFDVGPYAREAERLVRGRFLTGVSADLDKFEAAVEPTVQDPEDLSTYDIIKNDKMNITKARLIGATLVAKPAFQECKIFIEEPLLDTFELPIEDGMYEEALDDADAILASLAASAAPVVPPRDWFKKPELKGPTPITVTDDGRVFGHIAAWNVDHIGLPRATKPPRSHSNYAYFRTGVVRTDDGTDVPVGQLTLAGGHAPLSANAALAVKHYDDTASAVADVSAGEDSFGIWVSGALRPEATPEQVRALRASAPSGDWRPINGRLELVAVCQVNVPGFPVARAMVAGGHMTALVAAGARPLAEMRLHPTEVEDRLAALEMQEFARRRDEAAARVRPFVDSRKAELSAAALAARDKVQAVRAERSAKEHAELLRRAKEAAARVHPDRN